MRLALLLVLSVPFVVWPARADEEKPPYGDAYTPAELAALDRALHAANMTREDLTFRKDLTKGHLCLPVVREMLRDPLSIAPHMDGIARAARGDRTPRERLDRLLVEAGELLLGAPLIRASEAREEEEPPAPPTAAEYVADWAARIARADSWLPCFDAKWTAIQREALGAEALERSVRALRKKLPSELAWHEVFASPFAPDVDEELDAFLEDQADDWVHEVAGKLDLACLLSSALLALEAMDELSALPPGLFPKDRPYLVPTRSGRIALGTPGDDVYEGDFAVLVDPGGNDRYVNCRIGAAYGTEGQRLGFFADLGGDDVYECGDVDVTLGAAILGIAAFFDLGQGNDRYVGGHASLGAAMGGVAIFCDDGGSDVYEGKTFTQGAAGFGVGIFYDDALQARPEVTSDEGTKDPVDIRLFDNDRFHAWSNAQAFARCRGVALCVNTRGNDLYEAGGVYLHAPLFSDRYQSFAQGFAIGQRNIDYAGGVAMLVDLEGNDRYLGDVYDQGVGYWYGAGLLWDGAGNDTYEMTQYGQGSGLHLAVGGLVDADGHDTYVMHSGLGQGSSHDYAVSILHDRAGHDRYHGSTSCNGSALTNSVGIHIDRAGNDTYAGRRKGSINFGRPARGFSSIGVLLDLDGEDDYLGVMEDDTLWRHTDIGVGWDTRPAGAGGTGSEEGVTPAADRPAGAAAVPAVCSYEGELTEEVFDELWEIAVRWEVGDNRTVVPKARARLIAFGPGVLPYLDGKVETDAAGLELRAYVDVLEGLKKAGGEADVVNFLQGNFASDVERRRRVALYLTGELKVTELEEQVVSLLAAEDEGLARRAAGVLASLGSHAGDEVLTGWLDPGGDELRIQAALGALLGVEADVYEAARRLLDHPLLSVRTRLVELLVEHAAAYLDAVRRDLLAGDLSVRARRSLLEVLVRTVPAPDAAEALALAVLLEHPDWGTRADAVRLVRRWADDLTIDRETIRAALAALERVRESDPDPYVRSVSGDFLPPL